MKKWILAIALFLSLPVYAVTKTENREKFKLIVTDVEFGKPFNITKADMAGQIADLVSADQADMNLVIRFRLTPEHEQKLIDIIDGSFVIGDRPEVHAITSKDPITHASGIEYALVLEENLAETGALTAAGPRSNTDNGDETTYVFRTQDLSSRNDRIPIYEMQISTAQSFAGDFDIIFNYFTAEEEISANLDGSNFMSGPPGGNDEEPEEEAPPTVEELTQSIETGMYDVGDAEVTTYRSLSISLDCNGVVDIENDIDICSQNGLESLSLKLSSARDEIQASRDALKSTAGFVKEAKQNKYISKLEAGSILRKLAGASKIDKSVIKLIKKLDKFIAKRIQKESIPGSKDDKSYKRIVNTVNKINEKIKLAYEKCKHRAVDLLNGANLSGTQIRSDFPESIDDYVTTDELDGE